VCLFTASFGSFELSKGLGLLLNSGEIIISKNSHHTKIGVLLLANFSDTEIETEVRNIRTEIEEIGNIPGIKEDTDRNKIVARHLKIIKANMNGISRFVRDIRATVDSSRADRMYGFQCNITIPALSAHEFLLLKGDVQTVKSTISLTSTKSEIDANPQLYKNILDVIFIIADLIGDVRRGLVDRLKITSAFQNGEIPEDLGPLLDAYACTPNGQLEDLQLESCTREKLGLFCIVEAIGFVNTQTYSRMIPVNYNGAQLVAQKAEQIFVSNSEYKLGTLNCGEIDKRLWEYSGEEKPPLTDLMCNFEKLEEQCAIALERDHFEYIIKHCNFSFVEPEVAIQTKYGLLISGTDEISITEEQGEGRPNIPLSNRRPVLILSPNKVVITKGTSSFTYAHYTKVKTRTITYTYLEETFIEQLKNSAKWRDLTQNIDYSDGIDAGVVIVLIFSIPILLYLCYFKVKTSNFCQHMRDMKARRHNRKPRIYNDNYEENKNFTRNQSRK